MLNVYFDPSLVGTLHSRASHGAGIFKNQQKSHANFACGKAFVAQLTISIQSGTVHLSTFKSKCSAQPG